MWRYWFYISLVINYNRFHSSIYILLNQPLFFLSFSFCWIYLLLNHSVTNRIINFLTHTTQFFIHAFIRLSIHPSIHPSINSSRLFQALDQNDKDRQARRGGGGNRSREKPHKEKSKKSKKSKKKKKYRSESEEESDSGSDSDYAD